MKNKIEDFYVTQFAERGFTPAPNNLDYCEVGTTWQLNDNIGTGTFWIYNRQNQCVELFGRTFSTSKSTTSILMRTLFWILTGQSV